MINFAKLAALGAVLAVTAPFASAAPLLTGEIGFTDSPAGYTMSGGVFTLTSVYYGPEAPLPVQPADSAFVPELGYYFLSPVLNLFNTGSPSGTPIFSGTSPVNTPPDTVTFTATSFTTPMVDSASGQITFTIYGSFTDSLGLIAQTNGYDSVTLNPSTGSTGVLSENLFAVTPEPSSLMLLGTGLMSAGGMLLRRKNNA
ncbi:MAG: hypothetical protein NVSMB62_06770 [Acidobacteriaceae bacterium]